jgi:sugar phosphate isomerase/epimerase
VSRERIIWSPTVAFGLTPEQYVEAAVAAGVGKISLGPDAIAALGDDGRREFLSRAADQGVSVGSVDGLYPWLPLEGKLAATSMPVEDVLVAAEAIGSPYVNALAVKTGLTVEEHAERFAVLCDQAAEHGRAIHLEFSPIGGVADLRTAWDIVKGADRPNGGILFDTWHFYRGTPDLELLASIPGDRIFAVQISDARPEVVKSLWNDTLHERLLPGDGVFPLADVVRVLADIDALTLYGPEVISDAQHALGPAEAARTSMASVDELVTEVAGPG